MKQILIEICGQSCGERYTPVIRIILPAVVFPLLSSMSTINEENPHFVIHFFDLYLTKIHFFNMYQLRLGGT